MRRRSRDGAVSRAGLTGRGQKHRACEPVDVQPQGDAAHRVHQHFKEVQRLKTRLDQYTDLDETQKERINTVLPEEELRALRTSYLETAQRLKAQQGRSGEDASGAQDAIEQLDFEFVLFSSALIDYDYIMGLLARYSQERPADRP